MSSLSWFPIFAGALLVGLCDGQGISSAELQELKVKPLPENALQDFYGNWTLIEYWESPNNSFYVGAKCVYYHIDSNPEPNILDVTLVEILENGTRTETPQRLIFQKSNYVNYILNRDNPESKGYTKRMINFQLTATDKKDNFASFYQSTTDENNQTLKRFWTLTNGTDNYEQSPAVNEAIDGDLKDVGLNRSLTKSLWNKECAEQESGDSTSSDDSPDSSSDSQESTTSDSPDAPESTSEEPSE